MLHWLNQKKRIRFYYTFKLSIRWFIVKVLPVPGCPFTYKLIVLFSSKHDKICVSSSSFSLNRPTTRSGADTFKAFLAKLPAFKALSLVSQSY